MTSKYGFSVVAPINVRTPSSTAGRSASCCALLKRWISSRKRIVRRPCAPSRSRAPAITSRTWDTVADTAESSSNSAPVVFAITRASVVFPLPGRAVEDRRADAVLGDREPQGRLLSEDLLLAHEFLEPLRPHPERERRGLRQPFIGRV